VCGLNPHAGEGGHLGREEIELIAPALELLRVHGLDIEDRSPLIRFLFRRSAAFDAIVAMYHDQGLAPLKLATFGGGVNITLVCRSCAPRSITALHSTWRAGEKPTQAACAPPCGWRLNSRDVRGTLSRRRQCRQAIARASVFRRTFCTMRTTSSASLQR